MNYYISDLHIGHGHVIVFDGRPFKDLNEMSDTILNNWNGKVKTNDTVYILGDFIWLKESMWPYIVEPLAGHKLLVRGNHDPRQFSAQTKKLFQQIVDYKEIDDNGRRVIMSHYPMPFYRNNYSASTYMLYGHVHNSREWEYVEKLRHMILADSKMESHPTGNFINVGCMMPYMNYTPRTLDEIIDGYAAFSKHESSVKS